MIATLKKLALCGSLLFSATVFAQQNEPADEPLKTYPRNVVKMNLSSLAFNNYSFTYERLVARKTSVLVGYRFMPNTSLGNLKLTEKIVDVAEASDIQNDLNQINASNNTITAEVRFYAGRKDGAQGFYVGLYGRHASFKTDYRYDYELEDGTTINLPMKASYNGLGGGLMMGVQFPLAKRVMLDIYLLGGHYGSLKGDVDALADLSQLTVQERRQLQDELNDLLIFNDRQYITATVNSNGVNGKIDGPFAGVRGLGLNIAFAF